MSGLVIYSLKVNQFMDFINPNLYSWLYEVLTPAPCTSNVDALVFWVPDVSIADQTVFKEISLTC